MHWQLTASCMVEGNNLSPPLEYHVSKERRLSCEKWDQTVLAGESRYPAALHILCSKCLCKYLAHQFGMWRYQIRKRKIDVTLWLRSRCLSHFQYEIFLLLEASLSIYNVRWLQIWTPELWRLSRRRRFVASRKNTRVLKLWLCQ